MSLTHAAARLCRTDAAAALRLLSTAPGLARWNLGLWDTQLLPSGLLAGRSLFGGGAGLARVHVDADLGVVKYEVGAKADGLQPRIEARVQPGAELGYAPGQCLVSLLAWRPMQMDDERWQRLVACHEVEIDLIRSCLEAQGAA